MGEINGVVFKDIQTIKKENREYCKSHIACPVCGSVETKQTYLGFIRPPDLNKAWCSCGWEGVVDDLKKICNTRRHI